MSRSRIASGAISMLIALPSCSLLIDTNPDGVIDDSTATGGGSKSSQKGGADSNAGGLRRVRDRASY